MQMRSQPSQNAMARFSAVGIRVANQGRQYSGCDDRLLE